MARSNDASGLDIANNLQRFAIDNVNALTAADIEELLVGVGRQSQVAGKRHRWF